MSKQALGRSKAVIAMLQTDPLPGSFRYDGRSVASILESALEEASVLADAGFDAIQLQNMGDNPGTRKVGPEVVAYMTAIGQALRREFPSLSLSILVNWDAEASLAVAHAVDAAFVRVEHTYIGAAVTTWGIQTACCYEATRFVRRIGADIPIFADVYEPHAVPLGPKPIKDAARETVEEAGAAGLFISGKDFQQSMQWLAEVKQAMPQVPVVLGGGATAENLREIFTLADAVCVARSIKRGELRNGVDPGLAKQFMEAARAARGE